MSQDKDGTSIQVIHRMAALLDTLAGYEKPVSLKRLAGSTGLHASTAHRILATLADIDFVERMGGGQYRLGVKLLQLGSRVQNQIDLRRDSLPVMEALRDRLGETVNLTVREGDDVVYIERVSGVRTMRVELVIGGRAPLHVTGVGKLFLAHEQPESWRAYVTRSGLRPYTRNSITNPQSLYRELGEVLALGYARDREETEEGVSCIAVPVKDSSGRIVAGLSISAPVDRLRESWIPHIQDAGAKLSQRLGYLQEHRS